jgi:hypothetical protein
MMRHEDFKKLCTIYCDTIKKVREDIKEPLSNFINDSDTETLDISMVIHVESKDDKSYLDSYLKISDNKYYTILSTKLSNLRCFITLSLLDHNITRYKDLIDNETIRLNNTLHEIHYKYIGTKPISRVRDSEIHELFKECYQCISHFVFSPPLVSAYTNGIGRNENDINRAHLVQNMLEEFYKDIKLAEDHVSS